MEKKTLAEYLKQASELFDTGYVVKAGQIWQAILKKNPSNTPARAGLLKVRDVLSNGSASSSTEGIPSSDTPTELAQSLSKIKEESEHFYKQGCSLYDLGKIYEAKEAWEKALAIYPDHGLALSHIRGVRKELGLPMPESDTQTPNPIDEPIAKSADTQPIPPVSSKAEESIFVDVSENKVELEQPQIDKESKEVDSPDASESQAQLTPGESEEEINRFVEQGTHLYKIGKVEEAIHIWQSVVALNPDNILTKGYLIMAQAELAVSKGTNILSSSKTGKITFQSNSISATTDTSHPKDEKESIALIPTQKKGGADTEKTEKPIQPISPPPSVQLPEKKTTAAIPSAITQKNEITRVGPSLQKKNNKATLLSRLFSPIVMVVILLLVGGATWVVLFMKKDALLNATQIAIKEEAIKKAKRSDKVVNLGMTVEELKSQAKTAMSSSPLRAYFLIREINNLDSSDTSIPKLLDQAHQAMMALPSPPRISGDINNIIATGRFEEAEAILEADLRHSPNNIRIKENLARVCLLLAREYAKQGKKDSARSRLLMGAALFPKDPTWQARIKLLENLQSIPKDVQNQWYEMLG